MNGFQIWDSHVHIFPPEIYEHWETYAARDPYFGMLTKKSENGYGRSMGKCRRSFALC